MILPENYAIRACDRWRGQKIMGSSPVGDARHLSQIYLLYLIMANTGPSFQRLGQVLLRDNIKLM